MGCCREIERENPCLPFSDSDHKANCGNVDHLADPLKKLQVIVCLLVGDLEFHACWEVAPLTSC